MSIAIVQKFGAVSVQGAPRTGLRRFGVPVRGAFDQESLGLANALVGLATDTPGFELSMAHVEFQVEAPGLVSVAGAIADVRLNGVTCGSNRSFAVSRGDTLIVAQPSLGARVYVAFGSGPEMSLADPPSSLESGPLPAISGPQGNIADLFQSNGLCVSQKSDRVGIRIEAFSATHHLELPSEPQCPGTVQFTPDGTLIILGPDGPTIGGYPKIAVIASAAMDRVGQLRPGAAVSFLETNPSSALDALRERSLRLRRTLTALQVARKLH